MNAVRDVYAANQLSQIAPQVSSLHADERRLLEDLISAEWFTLGDVYRTLKAMNVPIAGQLGRFHSLINELAYSRATSSAMAGVDGQAGELERLLSTEPIDEGRRLLTPERLQESPIDALLEHATSVLNAPDLALLGLLTPDEIMSLRDLGASYFDLLELVKDRDYIDLHQADFQARLAIVMSAYWEAICDHLVREHPGAATRPTRIAIFLGKLPRFLRQLSVPLVRFAVNVGTPAATSALVSGPVLPVMNKAIQDLADYSVRFLIVSEGDEIRRIRSVIPSKGWVSSPYPSIYIPK
jgi:hypothetical protein